MAGVPRGVLERAAALLADLERSGDAPRVPEVATKRLQMSLFEFDEPEVVQELQRVDVNRLTPLEALRLVDEWKRRFG
jgi:DNA mismatch repair protein MutS